MASADLGDELHCAVCLDIFKDPLTLRCGHSFCRMCINTVLDSQEASGIYACPECRERIPDRNAMYRNVALHNIAERFMFAQLGVEDEGINCTYCDFPVPAVKTCLQCEASLCGKHLKKHSKSNEHVLVHPTMSLANRKCSVHKELLKYYCNEDSTCICVTCCLAEEHMGHKVEPMIDASEKKKKELKTILQELNSKEEQLYKQVEILQKYRKNMKKKFTTEACKIASVFDELRRQIDDLENKVLSVIGREDEQALMPINDLIEKLEAKNSELCQKIYTIEELCNSHDSIEVLKKIETVINSLWNDEEVENQDTEKVEKLLKTDLDDQLILLTLQKSLTDLVSHAREEIDMQLGVDI
ncbi:E3 ubiquitin/ISG15 ligase TRIM25-like [Pyxicephalus adspersus]|uniref:Uncharacterized protein n=1 Tax=Pyxicephalus adspersus TaxID=30357 RepID=A0AAV3A8X0_PYXAD|nr:TPA: hypothetical protein GDO54_008142 [Pyxicephalus adspersus]